MKKFLVVICFVLGLICPTVTIVKSIVFTQQCAGYIKQTADANSIELAIERLDLAIKYADEHNLTSGYTSILYKTENDNVEFWYKNLLTCKEELTSCVNASQLEKSNILMKVRESLTDNGENGVHLTLPNGISRYPNNLLFAICNTISILLLIFGACLIVVIIEEY